LEDKLVVIKGQSSRVGLAMKQIQGYIWADSNLTSRNYITLPYLSRTPKKPEYAPDFWILAFETCFHAILKGNKN